jgi:hypothetical protein
MRLTVPSFAPNPRTKQQEVDMLKLGIAAFIMLLPNVAFTADISGCISRCDAAWMR